MARESDVPGEAAAAPESLAWGTSPVLYLSYGMAASSKGTRPALTDAVAAAPSFTLLSPPMGLDYFAVYDGRRHLGTPGAAERLLGQLAAAIAGQVNGELMRENPRFGETSSLSVAGWWRTALHEAYKAVDKEVVASSAGKGARAGATTALVVLVLEDYIVVANRGASRALMCRGREHVDLTYEHRANNMADENKSVEKESAGGQVLGSTSKKLDNVPAQTTGAPARSAPAADGAVLYVAVVARDARDEFLVLGSGGLWAGGVTPATACAFVRRRLGVTSRIAMPWEPPLGASCGSPTVLARELATQAVRGGGKHDASVAVILLRNFWAPSATSGEAKSAAEAQRGDGNGRVVAADVDDERRGDGGGAGGLSAGEPLRRQSKRSSRANPRFSGQRRSRGALAPRGKQA